MKELDFDELDRAVNTLMNDVPASVQAPKPDDTTRILTIPSTLNESEMPVMPSFTNDATATASPVQDAVVATTPTPGVPAQSMHAPLATRRTGRFMDVVHPSSDMKNPSNEPRTVSSRTAPTLQPLASASTLVPERTESLVSTPFASAANDTNDAPPRVETAMAAASDTEVVPDVMDWPDPLANFSTEPDTVSLVAADLAPVLTDATPEDEETDDDLFMVDETESDDEPQPLVSPFLSDTKVEKRPLGSPLTVDPAEEPDRAPVMGVLARDDLTQSNPDDQLPADPSAAGIQLPAELQGDLMAVESDTTSNYDATPSADVPAETTSLNEANPAPQPQAATESSATGPTSIQQQYQETAGTGDQTNGAIYDTEAYHQPLAHPAKKKSGWMWVVWVALILLVGIGGGVALYLLKII